MFVCLEMQSCPVPLPGCGAGAGRAQPCRVELALELPWFEPHDTPSLLNSLGLKSQTVGDDNLQRDLPVFPHLAGHDSTALGWGKSLGDLPKELVNLRKSWETLLEKQQQEDCSFTRTFKTLKNCWNQGEHTYDGGTGGAGAILCVLS